MIRTYVEVLMNMMPIFASIVIFAVYAAQQGTEKLTPAKVYTVLSIFNLIAGPMRLMVMTLINFMNAKASLARIEHFFGYEEKNEFGFDTDAK
jgi:ATP-binding cassette subfamily C (CFTR/MRP) protein 1